MEHDRGIIRERRHGISGDGALRRTAENERRGHLCAGSRFRRRGGGSQAAGGVAARRHAVRRHRRARVPRDGRFHQAWSGPERRCGRHAQTARDPCLSRGRGLLQPVRKEQGGGRGAGAGVRPALRHLPPGDDRGRFPHGPGEEFQYGVLYVEADAVGQAAGVAGEAGTAAERGAGGLRGEGRGEDWLFRRRRGQDLSSDLPHGHAAPGGGAGGVRPRLGGEEPGRAPAEARLPSAGASAGATGWR